MIITKKQLIIFLKENPEFDELLTIYEKMQWPDQKNIWEIIEWLEKNNNNNIEYKQKFDYQQYIEWLFKKYKLTGKLKRWYDYNKKIIWMECDYKKGIIDGKYKCWDREGILITEYNFKNGLLHGLCKNTDFIGGVHNFFYIEGKKFMEIQKIDYKQIEKRTKTLKWFQNVQLTKLLENAKKGTWENESDMNLLQMLKDEVIELEEALKAGNRIDIIRECADVSNFAMFIADKRR